MGRKRAMSKLETREQAKWKAKEHFGYKRVFPTGLGTGVRRLEQKD